MSFLAINFPKFFIGALHKDQLNDSTSFTDDQGLMFPPTKGIDRYLSPLLHHHQHDYLHDHVHEILNLEHEKCEISQFKIYQDK